MTTDKSTLAKEVTKKLTSSYTLEADFIGDLEKLLVEVFAPYYIYNAPPGGKKGKRKNNGKPRKTSAYNQFVKTKMPVLKEEGVPHKERMKKLGELWKALDDAGKIPYQTMADEVNAALETATPTAAPAVVAPPAAAPATATVATPAVEQAAA